MAKTAEETTILIARIKKLSIAGDITTPNTFYHFWNNTSFAIKKTYDSATETDNKSSFLKGYGSEYLLDAAFIARINKKPLLQIIDNYVLV